MRYNEKKPPREFKVGVQRVTLRDCGSIALGDDEQVTFITSDKKEYDVVRKDWGFYATPSLNVRLTEGGWRPALVKNTEGRYYVVLIEKDRQMLFQRYCEVEKLSIIWLNDESLKVIAQALLPAV